MLSKIRGKQTNMPVMIPTVPWIYIERDQFSPEEHILAMEIKGLHKHSQVFCLAEIMVKDTGQWRQFQEVLQCCCYEFHFEESVYLIC